MEESTQPEPGAPAQQPTPQAMSAHDVAQIVRDELDRNNRVVDFIQTQAAKDRENFEFLLTRATRFGAFAVGIAALVGFASLYQVIQEVRSTAKAAQDANQSEIAAIKAAANAAAAEAKATATIAALDAKVELRKQVEQEFNQANIRQIVQAAANDRAKGELESAIRSEAGLQVSQALERERPEIRKVIANNTEQVVKDLRGSISAAVSDETTSQIGKSLAPIQSQIDASVSALKVQGAITETFTPTDDRRAFIYLNRVAIGLEPESAVPNARAAAEQRMALARVEFDRAVAEANRNGTMDLPATLKPYPLDDAHIRSIESDGDGSFQSPDIRSIPPLNGFVPTMVYVIQHSPRLINVAIATSKLNKTTGNNFDYLRPEAISAWWAKNQSRYPRCGKTIC